MPQIKLYLDQEHRASGGRTVRSHLLAIPIGHTLWPMQQDALLRTFCRQPGGEVRVTMRPMDDGRYDVPGYEVYWLCDSRYAHPKQVERIVRSIVRPDELLESSAISLDDDNAVIIG